MRAGLHNGSSFLAVVQHTPICRTTTAYEWPTKGRPTHPPQIETDTNIGYQRNKNGSSYFAVAKLVQYQDR